VDTSSRILTMSHGQQVMQLVEIDQSFFSQPQDPSSPTFLPSYLAFSTSRSAASIKSRTPPPTIQVVDRFLCQKILASRPVKDRQVFRPLSFLHQFVARTLCRHQIGTGLSGFMTRPKLGLQPAATSGPFSPRSA
jgi:hypothetical protein